VGLRRTPRGEIPERDALPWLDEQWARVDAWIDAAQKE